MSRMLLCGIVGWLVVCEPPARADPAEDKAVAAVEKLKGSVTRDPKLPGKPVVTVNLSVTKAKDPDLKELAGLKNLSALYLGFTEVTDAGLRS